MSKVLTYALKSIGLNLLAGLLLFAPLLFVTNDSVYGWLFALLVIGPLSLFVQLIVGIVYAAGQKNKDLGKGMLLAVGLFLLIGLSVCGRMWFGLL